MFSITYPRASFHLIVFTIFLALTPVLSGCLRTPIKPIDVDDTIRYLALSNDQAVHVSVQDETGSETLGHQFMLIAIPFGRVCIEDVELFIFDAAFTALTLKGKKPLFAPLNAAHRYPALHLRVKEVQATAYDFFVIRWIKTKLVVHATYSRDASHRIEREFTASESSFKRFAFSKQLSFYFNKSIQTLFSDIADFTEPEGVVFESRY